MEYKGGCERGYWLIFIRESKCVGGGKGVVRRIDRSMPSAWDARGKKGWVDLEGRWLVCLLGRRFNDDICMVQSNKGKRTGMMRQESKSVGCVLFDRRLAPFGLYFPFFLSLAPGCVVIKRRKVHVEASLNGATAQRLSPAIRRLVFCAAEPCGSVVVVRSHVLTSAARSVYPGSID